MDGSLNVVCFDATILWHFDAAEWASSTTSFASLRGRPVLAAGSTGQRNTLIFSKDGCGHETATSHLLLGGSVV
jgi:hypothetical protein